MKNLFSLNFRRQHKQSAAANIMVEYLVGRPQHQRRNYENASREAYIQNVIANRCIKMISTSAASVDIKLFSGGEKSQQEIDKHPLLDLLYRPNPRQGDDSFFRELYSKYLIGGEVFIERVADGKGSVKELWIHRPDRISVVAGSTALPIRYVYSSGGAEKIFPCDIITGESDILHLRDFNPVDDWRGLSSIDPASYSIDQHNEASAWNFGLLRNGARPSGALITKSTPGNMTGALSDQQFQRLKEQVDQNTAGGRNAGRILVLEGDMDWKELSLNPKDMDFTNSMQEATRNIARAFGVPPILLGIPGDSTYNNVREAKLAFWEETILPLIKTVLCEFNHWLAPKFGQDLWLGINESEISALSLRREENRTSLQKADYLTINEKRLADGKESLPDGDVLLVDAGKVPLQMAGAAYQTQPNLLDMQSYDAGNTTKSEYIDFLTKLGVSPERAKKLGEIVYDV